VNRESLPTDFIADLEATAETYLSHTGRTL